MLAQLGVTGLFTWNGNLRVYSEGAYLPGRIRWCLKGAKFEGSRFTGGRSQIYRVQSLWSAKFTGRKFTGRKFTGRKFVGGKFTGRKFVQTRRRITQGANLKERKFELMRIRR